MSSFLVRDDIPRWRDEVELEGEELEAKDFLIESHSTSTTPPPPMPPTPPASPPVELAKDEKSPTKQPALDQHTNRVAFRTSERQMQPRIVFLDNAQIVSNDDRSPAWAVTNHGIVATPDPTPYEQAVRSSLSYLPPCPKRARDFIVHLDPFLTRAYLIVYVDDLLIAAPKKPAVEAIKTELAKRWKMTEAINNELSKR